MLKLKYKVGKNRDILRCNRVKKIGVDNNYFNLCLLSQKIYRYIRDLTPKYRYKLWYHKRRKYGK